MPTATVIITGVGQRLGLCLSEHFCGVRSKIDFPAAQVILAINSVTQGELKAFLNDNV